MRKVTFDVKHFLLYRTQMAPNSVQVLTKILIFHSYWKSGPSRNLSILKSTWLFDMKNSSKLNHHFILYLSPDKSIVQSPTTYQKESRALSESTEDVWVLKIQLSASHWLGILRKDKSAPEMSHKQAGKANKCLDFKHDNTEQI